MADHSTTTRNVKREKRGFTSDFANQMELLPWWSLLLVLSLRDPVFVWMLSSSWLLILIRECVEACGISGANVNEEQYPQVLTRKFLDEEERRNICRHKSSFTGLISVYREDGVCCVFTLSLNLALFRLIVAINMRAVNDFPPPQRLRVCITCAFGM